MSLSGSTFQANKFSVKCFLKFIGKGIVLMCRAQGRCESIIIRLPGGGRPSGCSRHNLRWRLAALLHTISRVRTDRDLPRTSARISLSMRALLILNGLFIAMSTHRCGGSSRIYCSLLSYDSIWREPSP